MGATKLTIRDVQEALQTLGYYDGAADGDYLSADFRGDLRRFQRDMRGAAGPADGWYGRKTEKALLPLLTNVQKGQKKGLPKGAKLRRWTLTYYYISDQSRFSGPRTIPMKDPDGTVIATVEPRFFAQAALEGSGRLRDGRLVNVTQPSYIPCDSRTFQPVYNYARKNGWIPKKPGYAGILLNRAGTKANRQRCFTVKKVSENGWPKERLGIPLDPYRTLATDTGRLRKHDRKFKRKGGVVPSGTRVFIAELVGKRCPTFHADGKVKWFTHDGWCVANDTGGGIYGAHFDVFVGTPGLYAIGRDKEKLVIPHRAHIWFEGIEKKLSMDYSYGL